MFELYILDVLAAEPDAVFSEQNMKTLKLQKAMRFIDRMYIYSKREVFEHQVYGKKSNQDPEKLYLGLEHQFPFRTNFWDLKRKFQNAGLKPEASALHSPLDCTVGR